jgi:hypothetical protein
MLVFFCVRDQWQNVFRTGRRQKIVDTLRASVLLRPTISALLAT